MNLFRKKYNSLSLTEKPHFFINYDLENYTIDMLLNNVDLIIVDILKDKEGELILSAFLLRLLLFNISFDKTCYLLKYVNIKNYYILKKYLVDINSLLLTDDEITYLKEYFDNYYLYNQKEIVKNIIYLNTNMITNENNYYDSTYQYFFEEVFNSLLRHENAKPSDIKEISKGEYSVVYQIKNQVLKVGIKRYSNVIPNSKYIVQPLLKREIIENKKVLAAYEISQFLDCDNTSTNDCRNTYFNLRKQNICSFDCTCKNVGKLIKDNKVYYKGNEIKVDQTLNGFDKNIDECLKMDNYVLLDLDHLDYTNNLSKKILDEIEFEKEYQKIK